MCKFCHFPTLMSMSMLYLLSTAGTKPQSLRVWALVDRSQGACGQSSGPGTRLDRCHSSSKLPKTQEPTYPRKQDDDTNIKVGWERLCENGNPPEREDVKQQVLYPSQITMKSHLLESPISKCPLYLACHHLKTERIQRDWERQGDAGSEGQKLTVCPIINGEDHLRLLNFQHNFITRIQNISNLQKLISLDLYDNQIEEISGLSTLRCLRVLLLGKNRIKKISNLENLKSLDVLDLHGNQRDVDNLPCLQHLFLSFNNISSFDSVSCLADSSSLSDITFDGNPIAQESWYKHTVLQNMMQLRQLDMKRITEEERRMASVLAKKEEEKKRESHKQSLLKEKKRLTINNVARQWDLQQQRVANIATNEDRKDSDSAQDPCQIDGSTLSAFPEETGPLDSGLNNALQGLSVIDTYLVEVDGDTLSLYGSGALESLDRNWSVQTAGMITTVSFTFIEFDEIVHVLPKLKIKFPNSLHLKFKETNLVMLQQFNALAQLRRVDQLTIDPQGNPVVNFTLWKYYVLFRLSHFSMQKINGTEVTQNDMIMAERLFGILAHVASSELPQYRLISILGDARKKQFRYLLESKGKKPGIINEENNDSKRLVGENTNRATLNYTTRDFYNEKLEEIKEKKKFCKMYIEDLVKEATEINMKNEALQKLWPQMFIELVRDAVIEIRNKNSYMKLCLQQITDQK
ncbi:PREDICTED: leucine-rich repeat-containing protein 49 isoform X3 [Cercocebus atys]|uniref:leucine-rich repeat-containing protein 49 isoform X3 n=1 Tax=Cercocebus atys TaxID=9531 RepID=UPI0005F53CB7|nr:PREDICTED: leucine-rich repeat-containing protein 49 isoform X3 [Cercocebus atys]